MRTWILLMCLPLLLATTCTALEIQQEQTELLLTEDLTDALPDTAKEFLDDIDPSNVQNPGREFTSILKQALSKAFPSTRSAIQMGTTVLMILLLCQTVLTFSKGISRNAIILCGVVAILLCFLNPLGGMVDSGVNTIQELGTFAKVLMPVMGGALAASGAPVSSSALCAIALFAINAMISFVEKILIPAVYLYIALAAADAALLDTNTAKFQKLIGSAIKNILRVILFSFSALLSITGIVSGKADAMTLKATKMAVSSVVPVVGGMIADATETVLVGAGLLLNSAGIFGMLAILAILIVPFLRLGIQYLILQAVTAIGSILGCKEHSTLVEAITSASGYLFAATSTCGILCFVACICFMKVSVA